MTTGLRVTSRWPIALLVVGCAPDWASMAEPATVKQQDAMAAANTAWVAHGFPEYVTFTGGYVLELDEQIDMMAACRAYEFVGGCALRCGPAPVFAVFTGHVQDAEAAARNAIIHESLHCLSYPLYGYDHAHTNPAVWRDVQAAAKAGLP